MKILVIRFSSIGDIVLTTPVPRCLKIQANAEVHYLTKSAFKDVLSSNPYIDKLHFLKDTFKETIEDLKKENFDLIIDLHHNLRTLRIKQALGVRSKSFNKLNIQKWLMVRFKWNVLPPVHIVDRYLETTSSLNIKNDDKGLDYFIPDDQKITMDDLPETHRKGYVGLVIGAQHFTKRLPEESLLQLCNLIQKPLIILGGKEDAKIGEVLERSNPLKIYSACGKYKLNQSASLVENANLIISHDTGLMHIAAAFKKKIFTVWGNTIPEFGMYPYQTEYKSFEVKGLSCRPCSKIGYDHCPKGHFKCMKDQDLHALAEQVNQSF